MNCLKFICRSTVTYKILVYFAADGAPIANRPLARIIKEDPGNTVRKLNYLTNFGFITKSDGRVPLYQKTDIFPASELTALAAMSIKGGRRQS